MGHTEPLFAAWADFYVIVGSSAAALTGLQFVVIALVADKRVGDQSTTSAFSTPTVIHFTTVLVLSGLLSAPWHGALWPATIVGACGAAGVAYVCTVIHASRKQHAYRLVAEDIVWHWALPLVAHTSLIVAAIWRLSDRALFIVAGATMLLLLIGIHNAWDAATFITALGPDAKSQPDGDG
jgi:hypothetical protein